MTARLAGLCALLLLSACGGGGQRLSTADPGLAVGRAALDNGAPEMALQVSEKALTKSSSDVAALVLRGDALVTLGRGAEAAPLYRQALAVEPGSADAQLGLGRTLLASDAAAAERLFLAVLASDPRNAAAANDLGIAKDLQNRHAEAQVAYRRALALAPTMQAAQVNLALSLGLSGRSAEAIPLLRPLAQSPGAAPRVRHDLAAVLAMAGQRGEAAAMLHADLAAPEVETALDMYAQLSAPAAAGATRVNQNSH